MLLKIKKTKENAVLPQKAHNTDAGFDLTAVDVYMEENNLVCNTGIAVDIPYGYVGLVFPRSSISKRNLLQTNSVGVIDPGYHGDIFVKFKDTNKVDEFHNILYQAGERVAQLMIIKTEDIEWEEVSDLGTSERGEGGFGSTN
jgi:dUTP pyrophosphatase